MIFPRKNRDQFKLSNKIKYCQIALFWLSFLTLKISFVVVYTDDIK